MQAEFFRRHSRQNGPNSFIGLQKKFEEIKCEDKARGKIFIYICIYQPFYMPLKLAFCYKTVKKIHSKFNSSVHNAE